VRQQLLEEKKKILVVDDEDRNLRLMEAFLIPLGYEVSFAHDGEEAIEVVKSQRPDLLLLDIMMPKMDGYEVARRLKADDRTNIIPIVMVTALTEVESRVRALEAGADDFLSKPIDKTEVRARVASLLKVKAYNDHMINYQKTLEEEVANRLAELRQAFEKIKVASLDTIYRLSRAAEYKDEDTGAHILRISNYSAIIARTMGLDEQTVESILYAAPMHDIGKIGIPDKILLKPAKLDPDESMIMEQHTVIGGKILEAADADVIRLGEIIALTHHEKWDGTGYPKGLKGGEIPLVGRIVAIVDVFDALTSKRPYKEPFSLNKSYGIIKEGSGTHFDPNIADAFFASQDKLLAMKEKYKDERKSLLLQMVGNAS
jgi:putative two-component system response regulator